LLLLLMPVLLLLLLLQQGCLMLHSSPVLQHNTKPCTLSP
jgi:hypothetical protein